MVSALSIIRLPLFGTQFHLKSANLLLLLAPKQTAKPTFAESFHCSNWLIQTSRPVQCVSVCVCVRTFAYFLNCSFIMLYVMFLIFCFCFCLVYSIDAYWGTCTALWGRAGIEMRFKSVIYYYYCFIKLWHWLIPLALGMKSHELRPTEFWRLESFQCQCLYLIALVLLSNSRRHWWAN